MLPLQRQNMIVEFLTSNDIASFHDLAEMLNVSTMTVRRDVIELYQQGKVKTVYGGVQLGRIKKVIWPMILSIM